MALISVWILSFFGGGWGGEGRREIDVAISDFFFFFVFLSEKFLPRFFQANNSTSILFFNKRMYVWFINGVRKKGKSCLKLSFFPFVNVARIFYREKNMTDNRNIGF